MSDSSEQGEWRTIESAPRDGVFLAVDAVRGSPYYFIGVCHDGAIFDDSSGEVLTTVTHWTLLPAPPEEPRKK